MVGREGRVTSCTPYRLEHPVFIHPLARDDQHLIQDFMLTKIALLLAQHAERSAWEFEMAAMDDQASAAPSGPHTFLFIYTVARYRVALLRAQSSDLNESELATNDAPFMADFTKAIAHNDAALALNLWMKSPFSVEATISSPAVQRLAFGLVEPVTVGSPTLLSTNLADFLPDPFTADTNTK